MTISTDALFLASMELRASYKAVIDLRSALHHIHSSDSYIVWWGTLAEREPYVLPVAVVPEALRRAGFVDADNRLLVKINKIGNVIFVTDGVWVSPDVRVFPFCDESVTLLRQVAKRGLDIWADTAVDLATGCGHNAIALQRTPRRIAYDINPRAIAFGTINRMLNDIYGSHLYLGLNDIRDGIPRIVSPGRARRILFMANMPFAPAPADRNVPLTTNGGRMGTDLQEATFRAITEFTEETGADVRVVMLGITPGDRATDRWDFVEKAKANLPKARSFAWRILEDEKIFRVDGRRQIDNPAPIGEALSKFGSCKLYYREDQQPSMREGFAELGRSIAAAGSPDLAYGVVEATI